MLVEIYCRELTTENPKNLMWCFLKRSSLAKSSELMHIKENELDFWIFQKFGFDSNRKAQVCLLKIKNWCWSRSWLFNVENFKILIWCRSKNLFCLLKISKFWLDDDWETRVWQLENSESMLVEEFKSGWSRTSS